jgi:hypothetical protein
MYLLANIVSGSEEKNANKDSVMVPKRLYVKNLDTYNHDGEKSGIINSNSKHINESSSDMYRNVLMIKNEEMRGNHKRKQHSKHSIPVRRENKLMDSKVEIASAMSIDLTRDERIQPKKSRDWITYGLSPSSALLRNDPRTSGEYIDYRYTRQYNDSHLFIGNRYSGEYTHADYYRQYDPYESRRRTFDEFRDYSQRNRNEIEYQYRPSQELHPPGFVYIPKFTMGDQSAPEYYEGQYESRANGSGRSLRIHRSDNGGVPYPQDVHFNHGPSVYYANNDDNARFSFDRNDGAPSRNLSNEYGYSGSLHDVRNYINQNGQVSVSKRTSSLMHRQGSSKSKHSSKSKKKSDKCNIL